MMLGKRARHPMKRKTSLIEITFDLNTSYTTTNNNPEGGQHHQQVAYGGEPGEGWRPENLDQRLCMMSPRTTHRRASADFLETPHFLKSCALCHRRLVPNHDVYMYRGDGGFCSLECRQQQMNQDERKEKCSLGATKTEALATSTTGTGTAPDVSSNSETTTIVAS